MFGSPERRMHSIGDNRFPTVAGTGFVALDIIVSSTSQVPFRRRAGGTCGNVLGILAFLGFRAVPIVRLGTDAATDCLVTDLGSLGVECRHIQRDPDAKTPRVVEYPPKNIGENHRFGFICPICARRFPRRSELKLGAAIESVRETRPKLFFFDRASAKVVALANEARRLGAVVMFEPASPKDTRAFAEAVSVSDIVKYSCSLTSNGKEAGLRGSGPRPTLFVETMGRAGLRYMRQSKASQHSEWEYQRSFLVSDSVDEAGAGDWCSAGIISRLLTNRVRNRWSERTIGRMLAFGQALAAASTLFQGPRGYLEGTSREEILRATRSTLRSGLVPDWIVEDRESLDRGQEPYHISDGCELCFSTG